MFSICPDGVIISHQQNRDSQSLGTCFLDNLKHALNIDTVLQGLSVGLLNDHAVRERVCERDTKLNDIFSIRQNELSEPWMQSSHTCPAGLQA